MGGGNAVIAGHHTWTRPGNRCWPWEKSPTPLEGRPYHCITVEDSGTSVTDVQVMTESTPWTPGFVEDVDHGGAPPPSTAYGVFVAIQAAVRHRLGQHDLNWAPG